MDDVATAIEDAYRTRYTGFRSALAVVTGSDDSAHDAVQEAFAQALRHRRKFRGGSLEAWIWRIAVRAAVRDRGRRRLFRNGSAPDLAVADPERDPELANAVRRLSPRRRLVVFLRYFGDFSYADIADICGISEGTVAATLAQAREELERTLREEAR